MSGEDVLPPVEDHEPAQARADTFDAAIGKVVRLIQQLRSLIAKLAYAEGARGRDELERALSRAAVLAEAVPDREARTATMLRLDAVRGVANVVLDSAPAPSAAAVEAAAAGDPSEWNWEEQTWIARRLLRSSRSAGPRRRTGSQDTRPDSPRAFRDTREDERGGVVAVVAGTAVASGPSPDTTGTR